MLLQRAETGEAWVTDVAASFSRRLERCAGFRRRYAAASSSRAQVTCSEAFASDASPKVPPPLALTPPRATDRMTVALGDRLMVGRVALDHVVGVRILLSQPSFCS